MKSLIKTIPLGKTANYLSLIMIIIPLMNFLSGISIDLYAPSMPAIAMHLHASEAVVKNTITATMVGFAIGSSVAGIVFDAIGRRCIILSALGIFIAASFLAPFCQTIAELIMIRFVQGMMISVVSLGSRILVVDHFTNHRFLVAVFYTSIAYGLGPVVAPFIGGYLQYHFGWQANFYAFAIFGCLIFGTFLLFVHESLHATQRLSVKKAGLSYLKIFSNLNFVACAAVMSVAYIEQMVYPSVGSFLVQSNLHYPAITFGKTALLVGLFYFLSALTNRLLLKLLKPQRSIDLGYGILSIALLLQFCLSLSIGLKLWTLVLPVILISFGLGFIFPNVLSICLRLFPNNAGVAAATQALLVMFLSAIGMFIINYLSVKFLLNLFYVYAALFGFQLLIYLTYLRKKIITQ